jgi:hypothetical protein
MVTGLPSLVGAVGIDAVTTGTSKNKIQMSLL